MNSIGVAGATSISHTTRPSVLLPGRVVRVVADDPEGLLGPRALERAARKASQQHGRDRAHESEPELGPVGVEHERLGDPADGAHEPVDQPAVRDEAAGPASASSVRPPQTCEPAPGRSGAG